MVNLALQVANGAFLALELRLEVEDFILLGLGAFVQEVDLLFVVFKCFVHLVQRLLFGLLLRLDLVVEVLLLLGFPGVEGLVDLLLHEVR